MLGNGSRQDHGNRQQGALVVGGRIAEPVGVLSQRGQVGKEFWVDLPLPIEQGNQRKFVEDDHDNGSFCTGLHLDV